MGPLNGIRIIEMAGIGPAPFAAMLLSDMGAEVIRIDRKGHRGASALGELGGSGFLRRGRRSLVLDLKNRLAVDTLLQLVCRADGLIEGFRPGVMERLGLGPTVCLERNPKLVYGRITGWGQTGPLAHTAGHDINYIALSGALHAIGSRAAPVPPLNLIGDFGGGGMLVAFGVVCALLEARSSGLGQVVDAAMTDGVALLMAMTYSLKATGQWSDERETNWLDGGAPFYGTYECADGKWLALGAIEQQFHDVMLDTLGLPRSEFLDRGDRRSWPRLRARLGAHLRTRTRDQWCERLEGTDACVTPVLGLDEAPQHPHNRARATFLAADGGVEPAPAPRFSRSACHVQRPAPTPGEHSVEILRDWGVGTETIETLQQSGAI
ncbi:MAG TPA: CaiB/BaiF CoA-transferase family protein [Burkholderiaceae bacterium]|nr:CaiB/BaiF CoA-transferase family protein [Burkholderiaceae bacterium]